MAVVGVRWGCWGGGGGWTSLAWMTTFTGCSERSEWSRWIPKDSASSMAARSSGLPAGRAHRHQGAAATRVPLKAPGQVQELRRYRKFCVTFRVFVVVSDVLGLSAADGLGVDALPNVGGVHGVWSQIPVFVLLVEDQVAVHLRGKGTSWSS